VVVEVAAGAGAVVVVAAGEMFINIITIQQLYMQLIFLATVFNYLSSSNSKMKKYRTADKLFYTLPKKITLTDIYLLKIYLHTPSQDTTLSGATGAPTSPVCMSKKLLLQWNYFHPSFMGPRTN